MPSPTPARTSPRPPSRTRPSQRKPPSTKRRLLAVTSLGLAGLLAGLLSGCASGTLPETSANSFAALSGNWQFSSTSAATARLPSVGGSLAVQGNTVTGALHPLSLSAISQCLPASTTLPATGSIDTASRLTLSAPVSGGILTLSGTVAPDRKSLSAPTYTLTGGACASPAVQSAPQLVALPSSVQTISPRDSSLPPVTAQQYQPVSGTYTGTLTTAEGESFPLTSTLTQTSQPDANGVYHVTGSAASPGNACVPASLPATASTIDGGSISTTYTDANTGATITGSGSSSPDASTITISNWSIHSLCGQDTGTGILTRQ